MKPRRITVVSLGDLPPIQFPGPEWGRATAFVSGILALYALLERFRK